MKTPVLPALLALVLGLASAQTTVPAGKPAVFASSLKQLAASGVSITLVDAGGSVVVTVQSDGTLDVTGDLAAVTSVKVGDAIYTLAARATASGTLFVTQTNAQGQKLTLPLIAVINRDAAAARAAAARAKANAAISAGKPGTTGVSAAQNGLTNTNGTTGAASSASGRP